MLVSINLASNRPENIRGLIKNIENTASNPPDIEVIFNIDEGDNACKEVLELLKKESPVQIKYLQTNVVKSFADIAKSLNHLLKIVDPNVEFMATFSDEVRFETKGWDDIIKKYIGYYDDGIFRIMLSSYRFRNYSDFWECVFAPDSLTFNTKKWIDTIGMWCPCTGPDSWQQLVSFYLFNSRKFDHIQYNRNVPEPFLRFKGEGASVGLTGFKAKQRIKDNVDLWFETVSHEMQEKAKYAAALLEAKIILHQSDSGKLTDNLFSNKKPSAFNKIDLKNVSTKDNKNKKNIEFFYNDKLIYTISYKLSRTKLFFINNFRKLNYPYYAGGGKESIREFNLINQVYNYRRIRKYGFFDYKEFFCSRKPEILRGFLLEKIWSLLRRVIQPLKLMWIFLLKITFSEKYYRLIRRKINRKFRL